jgi:hypothetical protein
VEDEALVPAGHVASRRQMPAEFGWGLAAAALSTTLALFFFAWSQSVPPGFFSGGLEFFLAVLFALFAATALMSLALAWLLQPKSAGAALAAIVVGLVAGLVPPGLVLTIFVLGLVG